VATRYSRPGNVSHGLLTPPGVYFEDAFKAFRGFFEFKTGLAWEQRLQNTKKVGSNIEGGQWFRYEPPILGRPRGALLREESVERYSLDQSDSSGEEQAENKE
jgi:hypothetical protein